MPDTTNVVHVEARLRETITREERRTTRWQHEFGNTLGTDAGYKPSRIWRPDELGPQIVQFKKRVPKSMHDHTTTIVQGPRYEWAQPHSTVPALCRSELMQRRKLELAASTDAAITGGVALRIDRPTFGANEVYNSCASSGVIGQAAPYALPVRPAYGLTSWAVGPGTALDCKNDATQFMFSARTSGGMGRALSTRPGELPPPAPLLARAGDGPLAPGPR